VALLHAMASNTSSTFCDKQWQTTAAANAKDRVEHAGCKELTAASRAVSLNWWAVPSKATKAKFIDPMLLLSSETLPEGPSWTYELKLDGYRALAIKTNGTVHLRSRNDKDFNSKYPAIAQALTVLPDETVIDGEVVALDEAGRPSFNGLQNYGSSTAPIYFYVFDVLILEGRNVMEESLVTRRGLLETDLAATTSADTQWDAIFDYDQLLFVAQGELQSAQAWGSDDRDRKPTPHGFWNEYIDESHRFYLNPRDRSCGEEAI